MLAFTGTCICIFEITLYFTYTCKFTLARAFLDFSQIFIINIDIHICRSISYNSLSFNQQWVIDIKVDPRNKQMLALTYDGIYVVSFIVSTCIYVDADVFIKRWFLRMSHLHISVVTWLMNELKWCTCILTYFMETICRAWSRHIYYRTDMKDLSDGRTYFHSLMCEKFFYCKNDSISYTYIVCHLVCCLSACLSLLMQFNCVLIFWLWLSHDLIFNILVYF